jgi:hypothetical protein
MELASCLYEKLNLVRNGCISFGPGRLSNMASSLCFGKKQVFYKLDQMVTSSTPLDSHCSLFIINFQVKGILFSKTKSCPEEKEPHATPLFPLSCFLRLFFPFFSLSRKWRYFFVNTVGTLKKLIINKLQ